LTFAAHRRLNMQIAQFPEPAALVQGGPRSPKLRAYKVGAFCLPRASSIRIGGRIALVTESLIPRTDHA
jgi:hypothetical protein